MAVAVLGFLGAGVFPLGRASDWHTLLIAVAFVAIVLAMYLLPSVVPAQFGGKAKTVSWCLAGGTALGVFLVRLFRLAWGSVLRPHVWSAGFALPEQGCVAHEHLAPSN